MIFGGNNYPNEKMRSNKTKTIASPISSKEKLKSATNARSTKFRPLSKFYKPDISCTSMINVDSWGWAQNTQKLASQ